MKGIIELSDVFGKVDSVLGDIDDVKKAFEVAKAYLNSIECNHDQTDRSAE